jgi:hypothetical protein
VDRLTQQRIAQNDATFRNANERIGVAAGIYGAEMPVPFICECADAGCSEIVTIGLEHYEEVRANPRHFLNVPGHEAAAHGTALVVARREGYVIVETIGHAGEVAEALDDRTREGRRQIAPTEQ